ncbi:RNA-binding protein [Halogranum tailed virus 1]|uniref:TROVE domain-containing protein n=1 Tax=Halogranum tailed virus 1 TaxID=1273749 RepID=R4TL80_9CAUD|nr:RNA-binding protein [Halogranum tailed virus 1]AGM11427.1 hypothetical protein HGTV1_129 [Halogranum tailed virus 1]
MGINYNDTKETVAERTEKDNYEGGEAYSPDSPEVALTKNVLTNLLEDSYYESAEDSLDDVRTEFDRVADVNPEFVLKLAKYARQSENLRQVPQLLLVLSANDDRTKGYVRSYAEGVIQRADEPLEVLAMQVSLYGKSIPNPLKKGIEDALHNFNEYQFAKWDRPSREWQYRDLLNLVHPRPRDEERDAIFEQIALGELDSHPDVDPLKQSDTWENEMSEAGKEGRSQAEVWREQLEENEDGYSMPIFARVRNVRNMLDAGLSGEEIFGDVTDEWVRNSQMYPFRFYQAYKAVKQSRDTPNDKNALEFLENAMEVATENLPDVFENTFTAVDVSGSMRSSVSGDSELQCMEIATLFGAMMLERQSDVGVFASDFAEINADPRNPLVTNAEKMQSVGVGGSTNGWKVLRGLRNEDRSYERIIVFTDMQLWNDSTWRTNTSFKDEWDAYKAENPNASLYLIDLQHYGDLVTPEGAHDVYNMSGWSEQVLDFIEKVENVDGMIQEIESVEPAR